MATSHLNTGLYFAIFSIFISQILSTPFEGEQPLFGKRLSPTEHGLHKEILTHLHVHLHITVSGPTSNSIMAVPPVANATTTSCFGVITMMDSPLTAGTNIESKIVGRAQGLFACVSQTETVAMMAMDFLFKGGRYNDSKITIMGNDVVMEEVREMAIIGGTGVFRFSRGYVEARTHTYDLKKGYANVEFQIYVMHY